MVYNPRHPHKGKVYRSTIPNNSFDDPVDEKILYEGKCRKYINHRNKSKESVVISEYMLSIPGTVNGIKSGDKLIVTDPSGVFNGTVVDCNPGNWGTNVYWNNDKN